MARKLGESRMLLVGAPSYLAKRGTPTTLEELETHARLSWGFARTSSGWPFSFRGVDTTLQTNGPVAVGDGETMRQLVLSGAGLARLAWFHVAADVRAGRLVPVMEDHNPGDRELIHAVFIGQGRVPMRVRAVLDFLAESVRIPAFP
jgi:DNA-binding transcriptional LysR family regulator